jgi:hypothetical protein
VLVTHDVEQGLGDADTVLALGANGAVAYLGDAAAITPAEAKSLFGGKP